MVTQVAQAGRIVMLSFHQPSPAMYELLDRVFLMARGHMVYSGEPAAAYGHFERAGLPCPGHTAVAEHMLSSVSDPASLQTLMAYVEAKGPHAGIAAVRTSWATFAITLAGPAPAQGGDCACCLQKLSY